MCNPNCSTKLTAKTELSIYGLSVSKPKYSCAVSFSKYSAKCCKNAFVPTIQTFGYGSEGNTFGYDNDSSYGYISPKRV